MSPRRSDEPRSKSPDARSRAGIRARAPGRGPNSAESNVPATDREVANPTRAAKPSKSSRSVDPKPERTATHVRRTAQGSESRMVDVGSKSTTARSATARAVVHFPDDVLEIALAGDGPKGPVTEVARVAGILAAKRTGELIPMCHPLALDHVEITFERTAPDRLEIRCRAACTGRTGVEMEALVGASVAALTVYDMTKAIDHGIVIETLELLEKSGGKSGLWRKT